MWVEELKLENIKCFESASLTLQRPVAGPGGPTSARLRQPYPWVTFVSENGGGKSTALQALALLLAGPESVPKLMPRPMAWLRDETKSGLISIRIHRGERDPGSFGEEVVSRSFGYSYHVTGSKQLTIRNRSYSEPSIIENGARRLSWLRQNAFKSDGTGWFAVGYGAFRRLTRSSQIIVPSLEAQARFTNFTTQFNEDEPLSAFERWMVYLDYRISKSNDKDARRRKDLGIEALNHLLPDGARFDRVTEEGRICFKVAGTTVPTISLSDGYRSILALGGDLLWRLMQAFPDSETPLSEEGVALIDELDIHLHPIWQRNIAGWLRSQFPNIQFIVATHSPLIAAGAGPDALTLKFGIQDGMSTVTEVNKIDSKSVDNILRSDAFGLVSAFSPQTQDKIDKYSHLSRKPTLTRDEKREYEQLTLFMEESDPFGVLPSPGSLESRIDRYLQKQLR